MTQVNLDNCASILKALADDTRFAVVRLLLDGPKHVGALNQALEIEQSLLSHHLKVLRDGGIVVAQRDGKAMLYQLTSSVEARRVGDAIDLGCCQLVFD